ncbi:Nitrogen permease reactivator protein, partial [Blyttiomyces sp. JEL0837]
PTRPAPEPERVQAPQKIQRYLQDYTLTLVSKAHFVKIISKSKKAQPSKKQTGSFFENQLKLAEEKKIKDAQNVAEKEKELEIQRRKITSVSALRDLENAGVDADLQNMFADDVFEEESSEMDIEPDGSKQDSRNDNEIECALEPPGKRPAESELESVEYVTRKVHRRRQVIKKITVMEGKYQVTRDVPGWESYDEEESVPVRPKVKSAKLDTTGNEHTSRAEPVMIAEENDDDEGGKATESVKTKDEQVSTDQVFETMETEQLQTIDVASRVFSQSEAVSRSRKFTEEKLKGLNQLVKYGDEEVTVYDGFLEEMRYQLHTQLFEQRAEDIRQMAENAEVVVSQSRKLQLVQLVDKMAIMKKTLRFQEEARERGLAFKNSIRNKREAFQARLNRLEQRQVHERNELVSSQYRIFNTMQHIRNIEANAITDSNKARRMKQENEVLAQQSQMKQQKEAEFLREIQLCKARQWTERNDMDIDNAEELEDLIAQHKLEEFELLSTHTASEIAATLELEKQKSQLEALQATEKKKAARIHFLRAQRRQANSMIKAQRVASRTREKAMLAEHPYIIGENISDNPSEMSDSATDSQGGSKSYDSEVGTSVLSGERQQDDENEGGGASDREGNGNAAETAANSEANKKVAVTANIGLTEDEQVMNTLLDQGREKIRVIVDHNKTLHNELKAQHRTILQLKKREHGRKVSDLVKEHEEELEAIKTDQAQIMSDLLASDAAKNDAHADTEVAQTLLGMMLPAHVLEDLEKGQTPQPSQFEGVTLFFTDINKFKSLVSRLPPTKILTMISTIYTKFDSILANYDRLYKVESVADTYMVAAGLRFNKSEDDPVLDARDALLCAKEMIAAVQSMEFDNLPEDVVIELRVGVHTGYILAGLVGTKMSRYCLFGDTVTTASRMCTTSEPSKIHVSSKTFDLVKDLPEFEFAEMEQTEVKGKGKMDTTWLKLGV